MGQQKRTYSKEFKLEAIRLYEASGKSMRAIEEELGISVSGYYAW